MRHFEFVISKSMRGQFSLRLTDLSPSCMLIFLHWGSPNHIFDACAFRYSQMCANDLTNMQSPLQIRYTPLLLVTHREVRAINSASAITKNNIHLAPVIVIWLAPTPHAWSSVHL